VVPPRGRNLKQIAMGIWSKLRAAIGTRSGPDTLPLRFELDVTSEGKHSVRIFAQEGEHEVLVQNVAELWSYGWTRRVDKRIQALSAQDHQTLLALRSLNPDQRPDGTLVFDVCPYVLRHLRRQATVQETQQAQKIQIREGNVEEVALVDYVPNEGLIVDHALRVQNSDEQKMVGSGELRSSPHGEFLSEESILYTVRNTPTGSLRDWVNQGKTFVTEDQIPEFFKHDLVTLMSGQRVLLSPEAKRIEILDDPTVPVINIDVEGPGWLEFNVGFAVGNYTIPETLFRGQETPEKYTRVSQHRWVELDPEVIADTQRELRALKAIPTDEAYRLPAMSFGSLEDLIDRIGGRRQVEVAYQEFLAHLTDFELDEEAELPDSVELTLNAQGIALRGYQRAGIQWLTWLFKSHLHGILADDMGLGKTLQAILAMRVIAQHPLDRQRPSLVVSPKSVLPFWKREMERFFRSAPVHVYHGPARQRTIWQHPGNTVYLTTYDTVARDREILASVPFRFVLLDEASLIKNPQAQRTRAVKSLSAVHRLALTGTPIENRPSELWSIFDFLMTGYLGSYSSFVDRYDRTLTMGGSDGEAVDLLVRRIRPFVLRRKKEDVARDLPEKIEMEEWCELTDEQKALYNEIQGRYAAKAIEDLEKSRQAYTTSILPILTKLKQVCDHPALIDHDRERVTGRSEKFDLVLQKIDEILEAKESVVVFTQFLGALDLLQECLNAKGHRYIRIDGSTEGRGDLVEKFNAQPQMVALCSLRAAGYGITLSAANHVIHLDRWWNPAAEDQATDRVHRIGQDKTVYVHLVLAQGTLEERICRLLERKKGIADSIIGSVSAEDMRWTKEEIIELLRPVDAS